MVVAKTTQQKIKVFVKTYLCLRKEATCRELTECFNSFNFSIKMGVTNNEMARFLSKMTSLTNKHFLDGLTFRRKADGTKIYYLKLR